MALAPSYNLPKIYGCPSYNLPKKKKKMINLGLPIQSH